MLLTLPAMSTQINLPRCKMSQAIIASRNLFNQATREGSNDLNQRIIISFVKDLINDNATYNQYGLSLSINDLSFQEKKSFLSVLLDPSDYEWMSETQINLEAAFSDYEDEMQSLIDAHLDEVWHSMMQEQNMVLNQCNDNGEIYYSRI